MAGGWGAGGGQQSKPSPAHPPCLLLCRPCLDTPPPTHRFLLPAPLRSGHSAPEAQPPAPPSPRAIRVGAGPRQGEGSGG